MNFTRRDLRKLRWPLLGALLLIVLAGLPVWWSSGDVAQAHRERDAAASRKSQIEQRLRQVRTEEQELKERADLFLRLQQSGIAGEENRLDWTELLQDIQQQLRLPGILYEFGVRKPLDAGVSADYQYFASPMRIQLRLLHEQDLLHFLGRLQREAKALVLIRRCTLAPLAGRGVGADDLAQLGAECDVHWITVRRSPDKS
jgi:hypothetical protein